MPVPIQCSACGRRLRVPDGLLGKQVKCPVCGAVFAARSLETESVVEIDEDPPAPQRVKARATEDYEHESDGDDEEREYEEDSPRRRKKRRRSRALEEVKAPAIALIVVGIIGAILGLANMLLMALGGAMMFVPNPQGVVPAPAPGAGKPAASEAVIFLALIVGYGLVVLCGVIVTLGGIQMYRLQRWTLAFTASIVAMLPVCSCCLLGLPAGIWSLVVLNRPEVKEAFSS
jgi:hypothetical protein